MIFSEATTLGELKQRYGSEYLLPGGNHFSGANLGMTLRQLHENNPTWAVSDMLAGLERLEQQPAPQYIALREGTVPNMIFLPAGDRPAKSFAVLLAGGAYGAVCTICESLPAAAILNRCGIDCYCLNYTTASPESFVSGLMPKPLDDLAAAVNKIFSERGSADPYMVAGFSAGGHTASLWGTQALGAPKYGLPLPAGLMLGYPLISLNHIPEPMGAFFRKGLFGITGTAETAEHYDASLLMGTAYPPFYLVRAADDTTVSPKDGDAMERAAVRLSVKHRMITVPSGGHGFGAGSETALEGWPKDAAEFIQSSAEN